MGSVLLLLPRGGAFPRRARGIANLTKFAKTDTLLGEVNVTDPSATPPISMLRGYSIFFHTVTAAVLLMGLNYILYLHRGG